MPDSPRYSEDEVALILRRAAELQKEEPLGGDSAAMSLVEIQAAAAEAGISRALVKRAATELGRPEIATAEKANPFLGAPSRIAIERVIDGEFPIESFDRLLEVIRFADTGPGTVATVGRTLSWTGMMSDNQATSLSVTVSVRDGQTRIRLHTRLSPLAGAIFGGIGGGVGGGLGWAAIAGGAALGGPVAAVVAGVGFLGGVYGLCRRIYRGQYQRHETVAVGLVDELERVIKGVLSTERALPSAE
jgi:hypothetical protein